MKTIKLIVQGIMDAPREPQDADLCNLRLVRPDGRNAMWLPVEYGIYADLCDNYPQAGDVVEVVCPEIVVVERPAAVAAQEG